MSGKSRPKSRPPSRPNRSARPAPPAQPTLAAAGPAEGYVPGVCNIGEWEIRKRRMFGILGLAAGIALLGAMTAKGAPQVARLVLLLPFWGGTFSLLQARRRFCAAFAMEGLANFGESEATRRQVVDEAAHRADMQAVLRMTRDSFLVGAVITVVAIVLPI